MSMIDLIEDPVDILDEDCINFSADAETTCTICQAEFLDPEDLTIHLQQIHKDLNTKQCQFCRTRYTDLMTYASHLIDAHLLNLHYCQYCLRAFTDFNEHKSHEKKHLKGSNKSYTCLQCERMFGNLFDLRTHDFECHNNGVDGIMLQESLPYLSAVLNVKAETLLQSLGSDTVYMCVGCDYSTTDIDLFLSHSRLQNCSSYVCDKCSNVYKKKTNLKRHLAKECKTPYGVGKTIECAQCHLVFDKYTYPKHKKTCKVIKCYTCDIWFDTMYELTEHQSVEHPLCIELKRCSFCWKQCVGSVALQKHIDRSHKSQFHLYKYMCIYCKCAFKHPQKLFAHFFSKHKDIDPYTCKICDKKFHLRKKFTLHIKLHHHSVGFVEFDKNYHVYFVEKKSENPFVPTSIYADQIEDEHMETAPEMLDTSSNCIGLLNATDDMSVTETEGNLTDIEPPTKAKLKRKREPKPRMEKTEETITVESSDDEPLLVIKKRVQKTMPKVIRNKWTKKQLSISNKKRFTCHICKKYCYTFQNYNHHISLHSKRDYKKCKVCSRVFRSKEKLNRHITADHSTSKLTETLKKLLEKRKKGQNLTEDMPASEKFRRTIIKVKSDGVQSAATITPVENGLSVQKFIENFIPETETKPEIVIEQSVSIKVVTCAPKEPTIKMTKYVAKPIASSPVKLSMPVKFKDCYTEKTKASIKYVQPTTTYLEHQQEHDYDNYDNDVPDMDRTESIPEVAEEVMLEGTEEIPKVIQIPHKIVIPKLPTQYKDIRIAHLLPQAPYYKIVKVNEVLKMQNSETKDSNSLNSKSGTIKLPDGTKLVTTNPLAHLLGQTSVEKVLEPIKNKYYRPKPRNFQGMLAEALTNLDKPFVKKRRKVSKVTEVAQ